MPRIVRGGLIQATLCEPATSPVEKIKQAMIDKHVAMIAEAADKGAQVVCLQELFYGPYFCAEQETKWYDLTEHIPDGPTTKLMCDLAKKHGMVIVVPMYEEDMTGVYYNTAAVIDADGAYLGKFRKIHIPQVQPGFWEKFYFRPGNLGYPVFDTRDRQGRRLHLLRPPLPRRGPLPGPERRGDRLQSVGDRRGLVANICGSWSSRPTRWPTDISSARSIGPAGKSRGGSASSTARATSAIRAARSSPKAVATPTTSSIADIDLDMIREVRNTWQFFRDRRPETYGAITAP